MLCLTSSISASRCPASLLDAAARRAVTDGGGVAVLAGDRAAVHALATALTQLFPKVSQAARQGGAQQQPSERLLQAAAAFGPATLAFSGLEQRVAAAAAAAAPRKAPASAAAAAGQRGCSGGAQHDVSGQLACVRLGAEVIGCVAGSSAQAAAMVASAQVGRCSRHTRSEMDAASSMCCFILEADAWSCLSCVEISCISVANPHAMLRFDMHTDTPRASADPSVVQNPKP